MGRNLARGPARGAKLNCHGLARNWLVAKPEQPPSMRSHGLSAAGPAHGARAPACDESVYAATTQHG
jgi:hypothetical protein